MKKVIGVFLTVIFVGLALWVVLGVVSDIYQSFKTANTTTRVVKPETANRAQYSKEEARRLWNIVDEGIPSENKYIEKYGKGTERPGMGSERFQVKHYDGSSAGWAIFVIGTELKPGKTILYKITPGESLWLKNSNEVAVYMDGNTYTVRAYAKPNLPPSNDGKVYIKGLFKPSTSVEIGELGERQ